MLQTESLTVDQVAGLLGLSRNTVYKMAKDGSLPSYRIGRKLRFSQTALDDCLNQAQYAQSGAQCATAPADALSLLASELAHESAPRFVVEGEDVLAGVVCHHLGSNGVLCEHRYATSYASLVNLYCGKADMALVNLYDQRTNSYNVPYVRRLCPGTPLVVMRLVQRQRGLVVRSGNPLQIRSWASLSRDGLRISPHQKGSAKRVLLDQRIMDNEDLADYDLPPATTATCLERVAQGAADVCVGSAEDAKSQRGLSFMPLQLESLDIVVRKTPQTRPVIRTLNALCQNQAFKDALSYAENDPSTCGAVLFEC